MFENGHDTGIVRLAEFDSPLALLLRFTICFAPVPTCTFLLWPDAGIDVRLISHGYTGAVIDRPCESCGMSVRWRRLYDNIFMTVSYFCLSTTPTPITATAAIVAFAYRLDSAVRWPEARSHAHTFR